MSSVSSREKYVSFFCCYSDEQNYEKRIEKLTLSQAKDDDTEKKEKSAGTSRDIFHPN